MNRFLAATLLASSVAVSLGACGDASEFTWTWDPNGCPGADASVVPLDAAPSQ